MIWDGQHRSDDSGNFQPWRIPHPFYRTRNICRKITVWSEQFLWKGNFWTFWYGKPDSTLFRAFESGLEGLIWSETPKLLNCRINIYAISDKLACLLAWFALNEQSSLHHHGIRRCRFNLCNNLQRFLSCCRCRYYQCWRNCLKMHFLQIVNPSSAVIAKAQIKYTDKYKVPTLLSKTGHRPCVVCLKLANLVSSSHFKYIWWSISASHSLVLPNQQSRRQWQRPHRIRSVKATKEPNVFDYVTENFTSS